MTTELYIIVLIIFYACFTVYKYYQMLPNSRVKSSVDNQIYIVRDTPNKQLAADTLAVINKNVNTLILNLEPYDKYYKENCSLLKKRYNPRNLKENILDLDNTTFTINKGSEVAVCLSTRDSESKIYDINKLMFVMIHELAHIGCKSYGHNDEFKKFFTFLLGKAIKQGIYKYENYKEQPVEYCGIMITSTPLI